MDGLPHDWWALLSLVFVLGIKHGLDADHLAAIDGMTRYNWRQNPTLARWCGVLFSAGHGAVVLAVALAVGAAHGRWELPQWLDAVGVWISIGFLTALGLINLRAVLSTPPDQVVGTVGLRSRVFPLRAGQPLAVAGVGALFAFSFDTLTQAALFALTATRFGGIDHAVALALAFILGMLLADGINGLWISRLIRRADRHAWIASRTLGLVVAGMSLLVAAFGAAKFSSPAVDAWSEGRELAFGFALMAVIALSYLAALRLSAAPRGAATR